MKSPHNPVLSVDNYSLDYALARGHSLPVLRDITLQVMPGEVLGLVGVRLRQDHPRLGDHALAGQ